MIRFFLVMASIVWSMSITGCGKSPDYPLSDDFNKGISNFWTVEQDGLKVEESNGELHISGTTAQGNFARSGIKTDDIYPETDFSTSVDFRVPKFTGEGVPLVYLIAHSGNEYRGIFYYARFREGYQLQVWHERDLVAHKSSEKEQGEKAKPQVPDKMTELLPAIGDEKTKNHRLRLDYESSKNKITGYVDDQLIGSLDGPMTAPLGFEICVKSDKPGMKVDAYFDNISVVSPVPPPPAPTAKKTPPPPPAPPPSAANGAKSISDPEAAVLKMMLAIAKGDGKAIEELIVPHPDSNLLAMNGKVPDSVIRELESRIKDGPSKLRRMEVGDRVYIGRNTQFAADQSDITADQVPLQEMEFPYSVFIAKRVNGKWKVDIAFFIDNMKTTLKENSAKVKLDAPEEAIVQFMLALMKGDKAGIDKSIVPNPESSILSEGEHPPENAVPILEAELRLAPYKRLQAGESFSFGKGRTHVILPAEITEDRLLIDQAGVPIPFVLVRSNGVWKVDAGPIIAGRKAAAAARKQ